MIERVFWVAAGSFLAALAIYLLGAVLTALNAVLPLVWVLIIFVVLLVAGLIADFFYRPRPPAPPQPTKRVDGRLPWEE